MKSILVILTACILTFQTGCARKLSHDEAVGVYRTKPSSQSQSDVITLEFLNNGRFVGRNVPNFIFFPSSGLEQNERQEINGDWTISSEMISQFVRAVADGPPHSEAPRFKPAFRYPQRVLILSDTPEPLIFYKEPNSK